MYNTFGDSMNEKIVFLGTPEFAATILETLIQNNFNVVAVISQPDKLIGRKQIPSFPAVKEMALKYHLPVYQPVRLKDDYQFLVDLQPDLLITCAYGQILPKKVLEIARINNINVHASLLPNLRGGAPIQRAIIEGFETTGISIMQMIEKMDAGVVYAQETLKIDNDINSTDLFKKLSVVGADLLIKTLPSIISKQNQGIIQDETKVTYAFNIKRDEEKINFNKSCKDVHNLIRGLSLTPGAYCYLKNKVLKIYKTNIYKLAKDNVEIGTLKIENKKILVKCEDGYLEILVLQLEGKKILTAKEFLNGNQDLNNQILI